MRASSFSRVLVLALGLPFVGACSDAISDASETPSAGAEAGPAVVRDDNDNDNDNDTDEADAAVGPDNPGTDGGVEPVNDCPRVRVVVPAGDSLNMRKTAMTGAPVVDRLPNGVVVSVGEKVKGEAVSGNTDWYKVGFSPNVGYVSAVFAKCTMDKARELTKPKEFRLPLKCKTSARISQGNNGSTSHSGRAQYAFDFAIPVGTPLVAMADGIVLYRFAQTGPGDNCYNGGGPECFPFANYVVLRHGDGTASIYKHLTKVAVSLGEFVPSGTAVGLSGSTGYSTGPHAHIMRQNECGAATSCQSLPVKFADVVGNGVPTAGQTVTSANGCPP